jgi:hypothetical protein
MAGEKTVAAFAASPFSGSVNWGTHMPRFWQLTSPRYSDYKHTWINGTVDHPFSLPGIRCDACGQTWASAARVLPPTGPVSFLRYREICDAICWISKCTPADLHPGNSLLPSSMAIPSRPRADFLWGSLGSVIVSERIKECFAHANFTGALLFPITITNVGVRNAKLPAPIPESGEPEDIMEHAVHAPGREVGQYFEMIVTADSDRVKATEPSFVCRACGFEQWSPPKSWIMDESLWTGTDVFCLAPTSMIVVTNRVKERLVQIGATNVRAVLIGPTLSVLLEALKDGNALNRPQAAIALGGMGAQAKTAILHLREALKDEDWSVRHFAAEALKEIDAKSPKTSCGGT